MASFVGRLQNILVSKWFSVVLISFLLFWLTIFPITNISAQTCDTNWNILSIIGIKSDYQSGETISGNISFRLNNPSVCPGCLQQILVGIVDSQTEVIDVQCVYDGIPKVCPQWTIGTANFSLKNPVTPGKYKIIAANYYQHSCSDAINRYAPNGSIHTALVEYRIIATIIISASETNEKSVVPTTPPLPPLTQGDTTSSSSASNANQEGTVPTTGSNTPLIITIVALLILLLIFSFLSSKARKGFIKFILILAIVSFLGLLFLIYGTPAISKWIGENQSTIIGVLLSLSAMAIAGIAIWLNKDKILGWIKKLLEPFPSAPKPEKGDYNYIYIMRCQAYRKNLYKIGQSRDPEKRARELSSPTGVAGRFEVLDKYKLPKHDAVLAELRVHKALERYRANDNREFFEVPIRTIIDTIRKILSEMGYGD
jgi:hypothetical protein